VPDQPEGIISNVVKSLNTTFNTPLFHEIYYPSTGIRSKKDKIKMAALCVAIKKARITNDFTLQELRNPLYEKEYGLLTKGVSTSLINYFRVLEQEFPNNWRLRAKGFILSNGGIAVMIRLFEKILSRSMAKNKTAPSENDFRTYTKALKEDLENSDGRKLKSLRLKCTSEGGRDEVLTEMVVKIRDETGDIQFGGDIELKEFRQLERILKSTIKNKLYNNEDKDWFKKVVDRNTYNRILENMRKNGVTDENNAYLHMTLGQSIDLMRRKKEIFYPIFINDNEEGFSTEPDLENAFRVITSVRNKSDSHYTGVKKKKDEDKIMSLYLDKVLACLNIAK
jgi:hypothetical protein